MSLTDGGLRNAQEEAMWEGACIECAKANGYTPEQADNCENGELKCKGCPFKKYGDEDKNMACV